jgi:hypothetical protein
MSCAPKYFHVDPVQSFEQGIIIVMKHHTNSGKVSNIVGDILNSSHTSWYVDKVRVFNNDKYLFTFDSFTYPYTMGMVKSLPAGNNQEVLIETFMTHAKTSQDGKGEIWMGSKTVPIDIHPGDVYAFVVEVDSKESISLLDIYKIVDQPTVEWMHEIKEGNDVYEFSTLLYPELIKGEKVFSRLEFTK